MSDESQPDPSCTVCERRLLPGERPIDFVTGDGAAVAVCELCKPRAEAAGWLRPDDYESMRVAAPGRERRRPRGANAFGGLLSRLGGPADAAEPEAARPARTPSPRRAASRGGSREAIATPRGAASAGTAISEALHAFNRSDHRRTVAGLSRTLGLPRATALAVEDGEGPTIRLTVAWELTWYQWEIGSGGRGLEVRESGKGETIDQLRTADRSWNLLVDADGTLEQKAAPSSAVGE
jgi:hypothetical protein